MHPFNDHPTVLAIRTRPEKEKPTLLDAQTLREWCLAAGADDVGFVRIARQELDAERADILRVFPETKTLICLGRSETLRFLWQLFPVTCFLEAISSIVNIRRKISRKRIATWQLFFGRLVLFVAY
ncbi:hypothetical protein SH501x_000650 [Pirellulaceae bacterium SH501]